jgi:hypothetical protein
VTDVVLTATTPAQVPAGEEVLLQLSFTFNGLPGLLVETSVAWRSPGGELQYGVFGADPAQPGTNTSANLFFRPGQDIDIGGTFEVYGVVRHAGVLYASQEPVVVTVSAAAQTPAVPPQNPPQNPPIAQSGPITPEQPGRPQPDQQGDPRAIIRARLEQGPVGRGQAAGAADTAAAPAVSCARRRD